jgi:hypothetical protein
MKSQIKALNFALLFLLLLPLEAFSQYFGRNKPSYKTFNYKVYQTPNFEIYHYLDNDSVLNILANRSESWYRHHQEIFRDTIRERNPLIFYENHADFQQTTAVSGSIGVGTGGVTEAFKQRVVMPLTPSFAQTDHVLGHELVHAFQFNILKNNDSLRLENIRNLPLWLVEGMAEYFSIGSVDPHTAMWMRDAVLSNDIPSLKDMTRSNKYFPYRYGQAVIAMIGKTWGDSVIAPLFRETAMYGYERGFEKVLGIDEKTFSELWKASLIANYSPLITDTLDVLSGRKLIFDRNAGEMNLSPSISQDGKYVVFLSEKDVFSLDLFLADAENGKILKKLSSRINRNEIDALSYLESSGTWSPDSKLFAFIVFSEGRNKLVILNVDRRKNVEEIEFSNLPALNNPAWSPDGKYIAFSAIKNGVSDIYLYEVHSKDVRQLTNDAYAKLQPSWSPDGRYLTYVTDKMQPGQNQKFRHDFYNIAMVDINDPDSEILLELFTGARNMNPVFSKDGRSLYFLSDRDGFRNLYRYGITENQIWQQTNYMRGITGITAHSPAVSIARQTGSIVYSYFSKGNYTIYSAAPEEFNEVPVEKTEINYTAATLPPMMYVAQNIVDSSLQSEYKITDVPSYEFTSIPYRPKFRLDYLSNSNVGVMSGRLGTGMAGSINAIFSDMVGDNQIFAAVAVNGEIYDAGGQVAYLNQKNKIKWGGTLSHIPYYYGYMSFGTDTLTIDGEDFPVQAINLDYIRMFEDKIGFFAYYPISQTKRIELSASISAYSYRYDQYSTYYDLYGYPIGSDRRKLDAPKGFGLQKVDAAYVLDNSQFGITGPINGARYRIEAGRYFGAIDYYSTLLDYRKYFRITPYTLAFRSYNYGRWGTGSENNRLTPIYLGYPWLIRGYERRDAYWSSTESVEKGIGLDNFFGSKIFVANAEFRIPFSGPERISLIKSKIFFADLNFFADGGLALSEGTRIGNDWLNPSENERVPVFSYGASFRVNLFGYAVIEPFYAIPIRKGTGIKDGSFGISFFPGW